MYGSLCLAACARCMCGCGDLGVARRRSRAWRQQACWGMRCGMQEVDGMRQTMDLDGRGLQQMCGCVLLGCGRAGERGSSGVLTWERFPREGDEGAHGSRRRYGAREVDRGHLGTGQGFWQCFG